MIKCIFFDVGGTLCESSYKKGKKPSFKEILALYTNKPMKTFAVEKQPYLWTESGPKKELIIRLCKDLKIEDYQILWKKLNSFSYKVKLYNDVKLNLKKLSPKFIFGILSNTSIWTALNGAQLGLKNYIKYNILSCKVGSSKPDVKIYKHAEKLTGFKPSELLYVGDTIKFDISPSLKAGWKAILICRDKTIKKASVPIISNLYKLNDAISLI